MKEFGTLIFYAKRFLPPNTTIDPKPAGVNESLIWHRKMNTLGDTVETKLLKFQKDNSSSWRQTVPNTLTRERKITPFFYATIKRLKQISIDKYPSPANITDNATSGSAYFFKSLPAETTAAIGKKRKRNQ